MPDLKKVTLDGLTIEVTDQGAEAIVKLQGQVADAKTAATAAEVALTKAQGEHAGAIATKDGEIAGLRKQIPDAAALDALVAERVGLVDGARKVLGATYDATGKSGADIKRAVAAKAFGDEAVKDKPDAFVDGLFTAALKGAGVDPVANALRTTPRTPTNDASRAAHEEMKTRLGDAWKTPNGRAA